LGARSREFESLLPDEQINPVSFMKKFLRICAVLIGLAVFATSCVPYRPAGCDKGKFHRKAVRVICEPTDGFVAYNGRMYSLCLDGKNYYHIMLAGDDHNWQKLYVKF
jgi:hypothetical protein